MQPIDTTKSRMSVLGRVAGHYGVPVCVSACNWKPIDSGFSLEIRPVDGRWKRFLKPFLARLGHKARRQMCPLYVSGLIGPGDRKSIQPMAETI